MPSDPCYGHFIRTFQLIRNWTYKVRFGWGQWTNYACQVQCKGETPVCFLYSQYSPHRILHFWHLWSPNVCMCGILHTKQFCRTSCTLLGDGIRSHRIRAQSHRTVLSTLRLPLASPGCHLCSWPTGYKSDVLMTPARRAHRTQETRLTRLPVYCKGPEKLWMNSQMKR